MALVTFRTKGINPNTWQIKQSSVFAKKDNNIREINYYKGRPSIFVEDNEKLKPTMVPLFEFNDVRSQCELTFDDSDRNLYTFLTNHGHYGKRFELFSESVEAQKKLQRFEKVDLATKAITSKKGAELIALGILVYGLGALNKEEENLRLELRELAFNNPDVIVAKTQKSNFENFFTGTLAFANKIVKTNNTLTSIQWNDNESQILAVAKGEDPIEKFGEFLNSGTEDSKLILQAIGDRLNSDINPDIQNQVSDEALKTLHKEYFDKHQKEVPNPYKNNIEWIKSKISE